MATTNPFDLLGDDDTEDPSLFIAAQEQKLAAAGGVAAKKGPVSAPAAKSAKLPSKPLPPSEAVREARNEGGRGGGGRGGRGYTRGRGQGGANRDFGNNDNSLAKDNGFSMEAKPERPTERRGAYGGPRGGFRGGRRQGFSNGDDAEGERPRRIYERRSGTGRGSEFKRDGAGRGNWGSATDEITQETEEPVPENGANVVAEKPTGEEENVETEKDNVVNEAEEKEPEEVQMTLEEYEKVLEEKRKALLSLRGEERFERKVDVEKEFESMQLVSKKKNDDEVFIKLGSEKDKRKEAAEKEERAKKSVSINEFLKPADGEAHYRSGGRGRGRGRGRGGYGGYAMNSESAPSIEDPKQFPSLGGN